MGKPAAVVLVVDDDSVIRSVFHDGLVGEGYQVILARNGLTAVSILKALYRNNVIYPACMLLDMQMPLWDGIQTLGHIRLSHIPTPPTILCSANISRNSPILAPARALGAVGVTPKLSGLDAIYEAVAQAILAKPLQNP